MTAGGAAGVATVDEVSGGDAFASQNTQEYGFQLGVMAPDEPFTVHTRILAPFKGINPRTTSRWDVLDPGTRTTTSSSWCPANSGAGGIEVLKEVRPGPTPLPQAAVALRDRARSTSTSPSTPPREVQPSFTVTSGASPVRPKVGGPSRSRADGSAAPRPSRQDDQHLERAAHPFAATWDLFEIVAEPVPEEPTPEAPEPPEEPPPKDRDSGRARRQPRSQPDQPVSPSPPSNRFGFGKPELNKKRGGARLPVTVPGPGTLVLCGNGVVKQEKAPPPPAPSTCRSGRGAGRRGCWQAAG